MRHGQQSTLRRSSGSTSTTPTDSARAVGPNGLGWFHILAHRRSGHSPCRLRLSRSGPAWIGAAMREPIRTSAGQASSRRTLVTAVPVSEFVRRPYVERAGRYEVAADRLFTGGLTDRDVVADIGAGHTELDVCLRQTHGWRGRYVPVDRWTAPIDLDAWTPPVRWDWFACLEVLEHLHDPRRLLDCMLDAAIKGVVITTPNPEVVDVLAMDPTHRTPIRREQLAAWGLYTSLHNLYGTADDGICGVWYRDGIHLIEREIRPVYRGES
jgi:hypothetical protein